MVDKHLKFRLPDLNKEKEFTIEVNWDLKDKRTNESKILRCIFPDGSEVLIDKKHFHAVLFAIGNPEEQRKMVPQKLISTRWYETTLGITATKDIRKGELINVPVKLSMPTQEEEVIAGLQRITV